MTMIETSTASLHLCLINNISREAIVLSRNYDAGEWCPLLAAPFILFNATTQRFEEAYLGGGCELGWVKPFKRRL